jgi:hypothetical protein
MSPDPGPPAPDQGPPSSSYGASPPTSYGYSTPPVPRQPTSDETLWAVLSHISFFVIALIGPLVVMLVKGNESGFVRDQAVEALNFHITLLIASVVLAVSLIGLPLVLLVVVWGAIFTIVAAVRSSRGEPYRYPATLRLVK